MKKDLTELVFILDRSGSMAGMELETIGGFNSLIAKQQREPGEALVTLVIFDNVCETVYDRVPVDQVKRLTEETFFVRGSTALLDAMGGTIAHIETIHKYARSEDRPEQTMFVIMTDGLENASRHYGTRQVRSMVEHHMKEDSWEFLFLGANIDAIAVAKDYGIGADRAARFHNDPIGARTNYETVNETIKCLRSKKFIDGSWKADIERDFSSRQKGDPDQEE